MRERCIPDVVPYLLCMVLIGCHSPAHVREPTIVFSKLPPSGEGSPDKLQPIEGRAVGATAADKIVLFARSGIWWVQPTAAQPFTAIAHDSRWKSVTHPGSAYAALLVNSAYQPPATVERLPHRGGNVLAIAVVEGAMLARIPPQIIHFSGYDWEVRKFASDRGGTRNDYDPANAWTDRDGFLHLRISKRGNEWTSAEIRLARSLGYGSYRIVVRDVSHLEPAAVFSIFTWDDSGPSREMDIEMSRWGEPASKNAQYVVQPYYVPANVVRFEAPPGVLTHSFQWENGRVTFRTVRDSGTRSAAPLVDDHTFTMGVPSPGNESVRMNLYRFDNRVSPLRNECEVIVEKFEYLP